MDTEPRGAGAAANSHTDATTEHFLKTLRDPVRIAAAQERDERNAARLAEEAIFAARFPADPDLAATVSVAVQLAEGMQGCAGWHHGRALARGLPRNASACQALFDVYCYIGNLRDALPDADDATLKATFKTVLKGHRAARECETRFLPKDWRELPEELQDRQLEVASEQYVELADGLLGDWEDALGAVLDILRNARAGHEVKLVGADYDVEGAPPTTVSFAEFEFSLREARGRAFEVLASMTGTLAGALQHV